MRVVLRVDASAEIGSGHLMRCLTLAQALHERGHTCEFICRDQPGNMIDSLAAAGMNFTLIRLSGEASRNPPQASPSASEATQIEDAELTIVAIGTQQAAWLVVDHGGLSAAWESALRPHVERILVIDDLADRAHDCDVLLDQNFSDAPTDRYDALTPTGCQLLHGPRYALLNAEYAKYRAKQSAHPITRERILVFFGGTDRQDLTGLSLEAISVNGLTDLPADIVVGANNPHMSTIEAAARLRPNTRVYGPRPSLADLMATASLSLGAGGTTTWERLCLGVPSVVVSLADNQVPTCTALSRAGLIEYLGPSENVTSTALSDAAQTLLNKNRRPNRLAGLSDLVDGLGSARVCEILITSGQQ